MVLNNYITIFSTPNTKMCPTIVEPNLFLFFFYGYGTQLLKGKKILFYSRVHAGLNILFISFLFFFPLFFSFPFQISPCSLSLFSSPLFPRRPSSPPQTAHIGLTDPQTHIVLTDPQTHFALTDPATTDPHRRSPIFLYSPISLTQPP